MEFFSTGKYISAFFTVVLDAQLEETGTDINKHYRIYNRTALHIAARKDLLEAAKWLINKGADLGAKGKYGITYLFDIVMLHV